MEYLLENANKLFCLFTKFDKSRLEIFLDSKNYQNNLKNKN